jgi:hypothetical protein
MLNKIFTQYNKIKYKIINFCKTKYKDILICISFNIFNHNYVLKECKRLLKTKNPKYYYYIGRVYSYNYNMKYAIYYLEEYLKLSRKFTNLVNAIEEDLITRTDLNDMFEEDDRYHEMDWYQANSYDNLFGKKYIGYLRREDNDSKFGSYPLHDDYSEDSNPDKFTNLDY